MKYSVCFLIFLLFLAFVGCQAQQTPDEPLRAKGINQSAESENGNYTARAIPNGEQELPPALGGGTAVSRSLQISQPNTRGGITLQPRDFGAEDLLPGRWLDNRYFLFIAADEIDVQDYYVFDAQTDRSYRCEFEVGESLLYDENAVSRQLRLTVDQDVITDYSWE